MIQSKPCRPNIDGELLGHAEGFRFKALLFEDAARIYGGEDRRGKTKKQDFRKVPLNGRRAVLKTVDS